MKAALAVMVFILALGCVGNDDIESQVAHKSWCKDKPDREFCW